MKILDSKMLDYALDFILKRIEQNMKTYTIVFPPPQSNNYRYGIYPNYEWTPSFWTGMYSRPTGSKPESVLWGDYFFFEALMRIKKPDICLYW